MQRVLVTLAVVLLVTTSLGVGALAANWPFWRRAWAWHVAGGDWPSLPVGAHAIVKGGATPLQFDAASSELESFARGTATQLLLRLRDGHAEAWSAPGIAAEMTVDGHGLSALVLLPLFDELARRHAGLLDRPIGGWFEELRQDPRGALTPRDLLAQLDHGIVATPVGNLLNPFRSAARLASGPDFQRAALLLLEPATSSPADQGTSQAAAAQLLAGIAAAVEGQSYTEVLEGRLWSGLAAHEAELLLGHRRGEAAAHCCLRARASDWLRLAAKLGNFGGGAMSGPIRVFATSGRAMAVGDHASILWVGKGAPPSGLEKLVQPTPDM